MNSIRRFALPGMLFLLAAAQTAPAQRTWIVDFAQGPGTDFADIPAALAAAAHEDTIIVRKGPYTPGTTNKGLTLLGEAGMVLITKWGSPSSNFRVDGLPAGRTFVMKGFVNSANLGPLPIIDLVNNLGRIHIEQCTLTNGYQWRIGFGSSIRIENCSAVTINECTLYGTPAVACGVGNVALSGCRLKGNDAVGSDPAARGYPGLEAVGTLLTVSSSVVIGGNGVATSHSVLPGMPAMTVAGGAFVLAGDRLSVCLAGTPPLVAPLGVVAIQVDHADVVLDPTVTLTPMAGAAPIGGTPKSLVRQSIPALKAMGAPPGGIVTTDTHSENGHAVVLFAGAPGNPLSLPSGFLWLDPASAFIVDVGFQGSSEHRSLSFPLPPDPILRGIPVAFQALSGRTNPFVPALSTPAVVVLH